VTQGRYYFRFNLYHRILHGMVIVSFLILRKVSDQRRDWEALRAA